MRSRLARIGLAATALVAITAGVGVTTEAWAGDRRPGEQLRRDADALRELGLPGVQARFVTPSGRNYVATSGVGDLATGRPVPSDGRFRAASTAKAFVATVTLQLVGEGRMSLDDTVERWLPGVVRGNGNDGSRITVRQLLQHTSGLHDDFPDFTSADDYYRHRYDVYTPADLVARSMQHPPDFAPGARWQYSSVGYVLVDLIIEKVTGRPWHQELAERVLRRVGMRDTFWPGTTPTLPRPHARGYQPFEVGGLTDVTDQVIPDPEAAIISTTADVNRFFRALFGGRLLRPEQLAEMTRTVPIGAEFELLLPRTRYGLGLFQRPLPCGGVYWSHNGGGSGYVNDNGVTADGKRSVAVSVSGVLGNAPDDFVRQQRAADALVGRALCGSGRD